MSDFIRLVNGAISDLKTRKEYKPGKEVSILVPLKSKSAKLKDVPLDDAKIKYLTGPEYVVKDESGNLIFDPRTSDFVVCKVTGKIR